VWRAELAVSAATLDQLGDTLAPDERARASRFRLRRDRLQFIARRGILRALLARYLGEGPAELQFSYNTGGRPTLRSNTLAERFFSAREAAALRAIPECRRLEAFFTYWTGGTESVRAIARYLDRSKARPGLR
jgi:4'-phosphopantetheinyl transferase